MGYIQEAQSKWGKFWKGQRHFIVMGMTGSGKTTFISHLAAKKTGIKLGHGLASSTAETNQYEVSSKITNNEKIYLIDTPGFDDTKRPDIEILDTISRALEVLRNDKKRLVGIIFLHRITDVRLTSSAVKNITVLQKLCGDRNYGRIALATTMWEMVPDGAEREAAEQREKELKVFWKDMFGEEHGPIMRHETNSMESAWQVVRDLRDLVVDKAAEEPLQIQSELCERRLDLKETDAGLFVYFGLLTPEKQRELKEAHSRIKENGRYIKGSWWPPW